MDPTPNVSAPAAAVLADLHNASTRITDRLKVVHAEDPRWPYFDELFAAGLVGYLKHRDGTYVFSSIDLPVIAALTKPA
jgi:hypothetical protein